MLVSFIGFNKTVIYKTEWVGNLNQYHPKFQINGMNPGASPEFCSAKAEREGGLNIQLKSVFQKIYLKAVTIDSIIKLIVLLHCAFAIEVETPLHSLVAVTKSFKLGTTTMNCPPQPFANA